MKRITKRQFDAIKRSKPKIKRTGVMLAVENLKVGEGLIVTRSEWRMKRKNVVTSIHSFLRASGKKCSVKTIRGGKGWAIFRNK